jgi:hypothetical protein
VHASSQLTHWILVGNGGVPNRNSTDKQWTNSLRGCSSSLYRVCGTGGAYGRLLASNASVLQYEHVENPTGRVSDRWAISRQSTERRHEHEVSQRRVQAQ